MKRSTALLAGIGAALLSANAQAADPELLARIEKLEQEIALLKRQAEVSEEKSQAAAEKSANVEYGAKGLTISSPDKEFQLKMKAYAQVDTRTFFDNSNVSNVDQFLIRTARPILEGKFGDFAGRIMLDFGNNQTRLLDAYVDYKPDSMLNFRLGKFKAPIGLERWQSEQEIEFIERGMATNLMPFRELGFMVYGDLIPQTLEYQLALTNGVADLGDSNSDSDDGKDVTARIFAHPFRNSDTVALQGLGIGIAGSYGEHDGNPTSTSLTDGYRTPGQARFFTYRSGALASDTAYADGPNWRINPQAYYYYGPFGALAEYAIASQEVVRGGTRDTLSDDGWTLFASYVLTGEDAGFEGVKPLNDFSWSKGKWGAFELLGRYSEMRIDDATFPTFADITRSAKGARDFTAGLNWYLNYNAKLNFNYSQTYFDGGAAAGADRETEKLFSTRAQFRF